MCPYFIDNYTAIGSLFSNLQSAVIENLGIDVEISGDNYVKGGLVEFVTL